MGKDCTKTNENIYFKCRKEAASYDERLRSRESAADLLGVSPSSLADYELGNTKVVPVDKVHLMADLYNAPQLRTMYCKYDCPIGAFLTVATEIMSLDTIVLTGVGVLVVKDGKFLVGNRDDNNQVGSPGGHIESWEDAKRAAMRETEEEFGITLKNLIPLGMLDNLPQEYGKSFAFLSLSCYGRGHQP